MSPGTRLSALIGNLQHLDKNTRIEAALEIGKLADPAALPALLSQLGAENDFFVRENIVWAIVRMGEAAVEPVVELLETADGGTRYHAAHTLSKLADARAVAPLMTALDSDDPMLVQKAVYALGRIGDERALPALRERLGRGEREMRSTVNEAMEAFGELSVPHLAEALHTEEVSVRIEAAEVLGSIGGSMVTPALARALHDPSWEVRFAAVNALRGSEDPEALQALRRVAESDEHAHVRGFAQRVVQDLSS